MSSSFVKDCSDVSAGRNTNYIIIVDSDTGNVALDGDSIQNLLANQVSVLHLGGADVHENYNEDSSESSANVPVSTDGATHVNVTLEGFSSIPIGGVGTTENYAELPLDADAFQRLESVLESEEAREILGEPLLNMVADPDHLDSLDHLLDPNILAGGSLNESLNESGHSAKKGSDESESNNTKILARRSSPMRRSLRQQDKATKEEVEKILAENQRQFKEEKAKMKQKISTSKNELAEEKRDKEELEIDQIEENTKSQEDVPITRRARGRGLVQGRDKKTQEVAPIKIAHPPRGRGRIRGSLRNTVLENETKVELTLQKCQNQEVESNKIQEIEVEPSEVRCRSQGKNKTDKDEGEKTAIHKEQLNKRGRGRNNIEDGLSMDDEQIGQGRPGRRRAKRADILVKPGDTKLETQNITVEKSKVLEAKDKSYNEGDINNDEMEQDNICEEKTIILPSKNIKESETVISFKDVLKKIGNEENEISEERISEKNISLTSNFVLEFNSTNSSKDIMEESKQLKPSTLEADNNENKIEDNIVKEEDGDPKQGCISPEKQNRVDLGKKKINTDIDNENEIKHKEKLQIIEEDNLGDNSKVVENIKKVNYHQSTRSKVIQVKNITEVKQVVMLNSLTSFRSERGVPAEPLVKLIPPKEQLPTEEYSFKSKRKSAKDIVQSTIKAPLIPKKETRKKATSTTVKLQRNPVSVDVINPTLDSSPSTVRRSGRAVKKKTFGDEMVTFDDKVEEDDLTEEEDQLDLNDSEEDSTDEEYDEDPERLWCICQKPHNNRFMICCDKCEDWFHGSCVGITKAMGQQMENESQEWVCPKCKKAERALKGQSSSLPAETFAMTAPGKKKERETIEVAPIDCKAFKTQKSEVKDKKEECLGSTSGASSSTQGKSEPRVLVYEKMTGKVLTGNMAPTLGYLKVWLKEHPEYAVLQPGMMGKTVGSVTAKTGSTVPPVIKTMDGEGISRQHNIMKVSQMHGPVQVKAIAVTPQAASQAAANLTSTNTMITTLPQIDSPTTEVEQRFQSPKKVIQLSTRDTVPANVNQDGKKNIATFNSGESRITVNSVDGKVTVKIDPPQPKKKVQKNFLAALNATNPSKQIDVGNLHKNSSVVNTAKNKTSETVQELISAKTALKKELSLNSTANKILKNADSANDEMEIKKMPSQSRPKAPSVVPKPQKADPNEIRNSIRKGLADCLSKRDSQAKDSSNIDEETIAELAKEIELQLYNTFNKDVGFKYKSRYRSLVFNISDAKNSGLFRKILKGDLKPERLAKMTSEELASKELAQWREMEEKKELKAIEKHELDMISLGNTYIMKSHKGEIEIDKDQYIRDRETAPETLNTLPQETPDVPEDSSYNHRNHVYDPKCKICTENKPIIKDVMSEKEKLKKETDKFDGKQGDDKYKKERRNSEKERYKHRKEKDKDRERSKEKAKKDKSDGRSHRGTEREKTRHKYSNDRDKQRDRKHSETNKDNRDSKDDRKHSKEDKKDLKEYKDSKDKCFPNDEKKDLKDRRHEIKDERKGSRTERKDSKDTRKEQKQKRRSSLHDSDSKRKYSESRSEDRKRHNSEKDTIKRNSDKDSRNYDEKISFTDMKDTTEVSTSEDIVKVHIETAVSRGQSTCSSELEVQVPETSSTVIGSPILLDECSTPPYGESGGTSRTQSPSYFPERPETPPTPSITFPTSPRSPVDGSPPPSLSLHSSHQPEPFTPASLSNFPLAVTPPLPEDQVNQDSSLTPPALHRGPEVTTPPLPQCPAPATPPPPPSFPPSDDTDRLTPPPAKGAPQIVWKGSINQDLVAKFDAFAFAVSGKADFLNEDVPIDIEISGRITPEMVWMYIAQMKKCGSKEILVVRFQPANEDEKLAYIALYSHLSKKKRYGVIRNCQETVKDFYVVPLASHQPIPQVLLPLDGPGFEEQRAHMLIGVIVRTKKEITRSYTPPLPIEDNIIKEMSDEERSYTPPPDDLQLPSGLLKRPAAREIHPDHPSYAKIPHLQGSVLEGAAFTEDTSSPREEGPKEPCVDQEKMLAELNRQIEEQKKELNEMTNTIEINNSKNEENSADDSKLDTLSKISIPSNLQAILDSINLKEQAIKQKEQEIQRRKSTLSSTVSSQGDVDLRPLLIPTESYCKKDVDLRILNKDPHITSIVSDGKETDTDLRIRDPRLEKQESGVGKHQQLMSSQSQIMRPGVPIPAHPSRDPSKYPQSQYMDIPHQGPSGSMYHGNRVPGLQLAPIPVSLESIQGSHDLSDGPYRPPHGLPHGPQASQQGGSQGNHSAQPGPSHHHLGPHGSSGEIGTHCPAGLLPDTHLGPLRSSEMGSRGLGFRKNEIHRDHHGPMHRRRSEGWSEEGFHPESRWEGEHPDGDRERRHGWRGEMGGYRKDTVDHYDRGDRHFVKSRERFERDNNFERGDQFSRGNNRGETFFRDQHHIRDQPHGRDKQHSVRSYHGDRRDQRHHKHDHRERDSENERDGIRIGRGRDYPLHRKDQQRIHRIDVPKDYQEEEEINEIDY